MRTRSVVVAAAATGVLLTAREYTAGGKSVSSMGCFYGLLGELSPIRSSDLCTVVSIAATSFNALEAFHGARPSQHAVPVCVGA